ncbi:hypothetical protein Hdeb2414_s0024g00644761 [Helianthus debilis subsp. tardiflorus]
MCCRIWVRILTWLRKPVMNLLDSINPWFSNGNTWRATGGSASFLFRELEARVLDAGGALGAVAVFKLLGFGVSTGFGLISCLIGARLE